MSQAFEDYCRSLQREADLLALEAEARSHCDHLRVFNFGHTKECIEHDRDAFWLRVYWFLLGVAVGVVITAFSLQAFLGGQVLHMPK